MQSTDPLDSPTSEPTSPVDPIDVCTLPPRERAQRVAWVRSEILPHAVACERGADSIVWEFADDPAIAARLERWVALERACCSEIAFEHSVDPARGRRRLAVRGVDPKAGIFATDVGVPSPPTSRVRRALRAAGLGTGVSLAICCALPTVVAVALGTGAAASIAWLDRPWIVATVAILVGFAAFRWRSGSQGAEAGGPSSTSSTRTDESTTCSST